MTDPRTMPPTGKHKGPAIEIARGAVFADDAEADRVRAAIGLLDSSSELARWWAEVREHLEGDGMAAADARRIAYRVCRVAELLVAGVSNRAELARRIGASQSTVRGDIRLLRAVLAPRVTFEERAA